MLIHTYSFRLHHKWWLTHPDSHQFYQIEAAVSNGTNSTNNGSSNNIITSDIISASNDRKPKNSNLLVNIQDKTEPEKNNLSTAAETSIIYNGTIPRNGTLCKKVYL